MKNSNKKLVIYDTNNNVYLKKGLTINFTSKISEAKDVSWMWFLKHVYMWSLNNQFPNSDFIFKKVINLQWDIDVPLQYKK